MLPSTSVPRSLATAPGPASSTSTSAAASTSATRRLMPPPHAHHRGRRGGVEDLQDVLVHRVDLDLGNAVIDVAHQAAPLAVAADALHERAVIGVQAEEL